MAMQKIFTWEILDSRDNPMVDVVLHMARGQIPSSCGLPCWKQAGHTGVHFSARGSQFLQRSHAHWH
uniref:Enolase N-terminal domain-containing protein n=1 Tax=Lynx canadensis TaxID=61383 RepID=A0A667I6P9_LYNCA